MTWSDELENPEALFSLFQTAPSLDAIEMISITMDRNGPTVVLELAIGEPPSRLSPRWQRVGANAVNLKLQLLAIEAVMIASWATDNQAKLTIVRLSSESIEVTASGPNVQMSFHCGFLRIGGISPYHRESVLVPEVEATAPPGP